MRPAWLACIVGADTAMWMTAALLEDFGPTGADFSVWLLQLLVACGLFGAAGLIAKLQAGQLQGQPEAVSWQFRERAAVGLLLLCGAVGHICMQVYPGPGRELDLYGRVISVAFTLLALGVAARELLAAWRLARQAAVTPSAV